MQIIIEFSMGLAAVDLHISNRYLALSVYCWSDFYVILLVWNVSWHFTDVVLLPYIAGKALSMDFEATRGRFKSDNSWCTQLSAGFQFLPISVTDYFVIIAFSLWDCKDTGKLIHTCQYRFYKYLVGTWVY